MMNIRLKGWLNQVLTSLRMSGAPTKRKTCRTAKLGVEQLEDRVVPTTTIAQWSFNAVVAAPDNSPAASTNLTTASLTTLGMTNTYNGGNTANDDIESEKGTAVPSFSEDVLRVRGTANNGWALAAPEYTQGIELDVSTLGYSNIQFSFDWYSTTQGIRDLQVQYNTDINNTSGWTNYAAPGGTGSNGISTSGTYLATPNDYYGATTSPANSHTTITVNLSGIAAAGNDPNFGIRLVSAYDSTGNVGSNYASATLSGGKTVLYNNSSGNWQFDNMTVSGTAAVAPSFSGTPSFSLQSGGSGNYAGITATGTPTPTAAQYYLTNLPAALTGDVAFDATVPGQLDFTNIPAVTNNTTYTFTINATNGVSPDASETFTLDDISSDIAPTFAPGNQTSTSITTGQSGTFQVLATGTPQPTAAQYTLSNVPAALAGDVAFDASTAGQLDFTTIPIVTTPTPYQFTVTVSNGTAPNATETFTLNDTPIAPTVTSADNASIYSGLGGTYQITATGAPSTFTYGLSSVPAALTANGSHVTISSTGLITFTDAPVVNTTTTYTFTVNVSNGVAPGAAPTFTLTVFPTIAYISTSGASYSQNFSTLPDNGGAATLVNGTGSQGPYDLTLASPNGFVASGTDTGIAGWYAVNLDSGNLKFGQGEPSTTTGALFDFNDGNADSQSLGTISTNSSGARFGAVFVNDTGTTLNQFSLSYIGEQWWANSGAGNSLNFAYEIGAPGIPTGSSGITEVSALSFTALGTATTGTTIDGSATDQVPISDVVNDISWAPGQALTIFWDKGTTGTSDGLGIAQLSFSAEYVSQESATIVSAPSAYAIVGAAGSYQVAVNGFPAPTAADYSFGTGANAPPSWVAFDSTTAGQLDFTNPPPLPAGVGDQAWNFTINVTNGIGSPATQTFTVIETAAPTPFTAGDLLLLQTGNNNVSGLKYAAEAPESLQEITPAGALAENVPIPDNLAIGGTGDQPVSEDMGTTANKNGTGDGQLERSFDSSVVSFTGNDTWLDGPNASTTGIDRDIGVIGVDPSSLDTTTYGPFNGGDDNRGAVVANSSTIYNFGHTTDGGLRYFNGTGESPTTGVEVDTAAGTANNVRDAIVGFEGQLYYSTDKGEGPGIFISVNGANFPISGSVNALPTAAGADYEIIPNTGGGNPNGMFLADMNGDGILQTGDRMYYLDNAKGLYVSTYTSPTGGNVYGTWSTAQPVIGGDPTVVSGATNFVGLTGQVLGPNNVQLYFTSSDGTGNSTVWSLDDVDTGTSNVGQTATVIESTSSSGTTGMEYEGIAFAPIAPTTVSNFTINGVSTPVAAIYPSAVTFTVNLSSPSAPATGNWPGLVYFVDTNSGTVLNPGGAVIPNDGEVTYTTTSGALSAGQYDVHAYYAGTAGIAAATSASDTLSITGAQTDTMALGGAPNPSTSGATVNFTATITGTSPSGTTVTPTGSITVLDNGQPVAIAQLPSSQNGTAVNTVTIPVSGLSIGSHPITIFYSGDNTYLSGTSSPVDNQVVNTGASITVSDGSANAYGLTTPGGSVTFTATVTGNGLNGLPNGSPTGSVEFFEDGSTTPFATGTLSESGTNANVYTATGTTTIGQAGFQTGDINGSYLITANYVPDSNSSYVGVSTGVPWIETAQQNFAIGDLIVLDRPNQPSNASQLVALDEFTPSGGPVQTVYLPDQSGTSPTGGTANTFGLSGHAATEGALALSGNESYLSLFGFDLPLGTVGATSTSSATDPRTALSISNSGAIDSSTTILDSNQAFSNVRSAVTNNGQTYYVVGSAATNNAGIALATDGTVNNPPAPIGPNDVEGYGAEILGGQLYVSTQDSTSPIEQVGTDLPTTQVSTLTPLPGLEAAYLSANLFSPPGAPATITPDPYGFLLFNHLNGTSVNPDTLYVADQTYGLLKFALINGQWTFESQKLNNNNGIEGLAGYEVNPGASGYSFVLFATAAISTGNPGNQLIAFTDTNPYNTPNSGGLFTVLASAVNPTDTFSGLAFAPLNLTQTVVTSTTITFGSPLTITVTDVNGVTGAPSGTNITLTENGAAVPGSVVLVSDLNNTAIYSFTPTTPLAVGSNHSIVASFNGDTDDGTSSSAASPLTVTSTTPISLSSVAVNGSTAPILSAAAAGGTVTITTDGPSGFSAGQNVLIAGVNGTGTAAGFNGAWVIASVSGNTFTYADGGATGGSTGSGTATTNASTGLLTNSTTNFASQRSMVDSIVFTFNQAVNLGANAITISVLGQGGVVPTVAYASPDGGFTWVVTFSGSSVIGNSIANGEYQIVLNASAVTAVSGGGTLANSDTESFYRLYGDTIGNGHQRVAAADNNTFLGAFNTKSTQAAFLAYLDYEDQGKIGSADNNAFLGDFNTAFKNFTATI